MVTHSVMMGLDLYRQKMSILVYCQSSFFWVSCWNSKTFCPLIVWKCIKCRFPGHWEGEWNFYYLFHTEKCIIWHSIWNIFNEVTLWAAETRFCTRAIYVVWKKLIYWRKKQFYCRFWSSNDRKCCSVPWKYQVSPASFPNLEKNAILKFSDNQWKHYLELL